MFCTRARSCARADDAKIVRSRNAQCKTRESPRRIGLSSQNALRLNYIIVFSRSRDHSFPMDFIEVVSQTTPTFRERKLIYLHCLDLGAQESVQFEQFSCLQVKLVLGHVSFPEKIAERRMCGFLLQKKVIHALKDRQSPVLLEVINSCDIKVSFSGYHSLVFGLAFDCSFIVYSMLRSPFPLFVSARALIEIIFYLPYFKAYRLDWTV